MLKQIEAMLLQDKKQIESLAKADHEIFKFWRDPDALNLLHLEYDESGLNFFMKGMLQAGLKHKICAIDHKARIRKVK
jgi:hypothetical protein